MVPKPAKPAREAEDFKAAHEIGKIYNSFHDKSLLCDFFVDGALAFVGAARAYLFLAGKDDKLWLESSTDPERKAEPILQDEARRIFLDGKPVLKERALFIPLIVRNSAMGIACFFKGEDDPLPFGEKQLALAADLGSQLASALKNILLFEENIKMERLAAIGQTMSVVMHEIKNIIQLARFAEEYLRMGLEKNNEKFLRRGSEGVTKAVKEMDGFTYEILSLTKDYQIQPETASLNALLEELKTDVGPKAEQHNVKLLLEVPADFPSVQMETRSLYRTLLNLVKNSLEACDKEDAWVKIAVRSVDADMYEIKVEDNGHGMSDEAKAKIFQAFFSTKGEKGTGLGLLVIDRTVKAHKGRIAVESEHGKGTRFILTLPKTIVS